MCFVSTHGHGISHCSSNIFEAVDWYESEAKQVAEFDFGLQALGGLCLLCGQGVDALLHSENMDREAVIEKAQEDRAFKAKLLLLHWVLKGDMPPGFQGSMVRTVHTVGQNSSIPVLAVKCSHFKAHPDLKKMDPTALQGSSKLDQKPFECLNAELGTDSYVAMCPNAGDVPRDLPVTNIDIFHRTETQLVEYQLLPKHHVKKAQSVGIFQMAAGALTAGRGGALKMGNIFSPLTFTEWKQKCKNADDEQKKLDREKEELAKEFGARAAPTSDLRVQSGFQAPTSLSAALNTGSSSAGGGRLTNRNIGGGGGKGKGRGRTQAKLPRPSQSPSPRGGSRSRSPARRRPTAKREASPAGSLAGIEVDLTGDADGTPQKPKSRTTHWKQVGGAKEPDVEKCLRCPDGGKEGRTTNPVLTLAYTQRVWWWLGYLERDVCDSHSI